jgi:hypothetical protein
LSIFLLTSQHSYCQFAFEYDSIPFKNSFFYRQVDSVFPLPKDAEFEIRLSALSMRFCDEQLFILTKKECGWFCSMYKMESNNHNPKVVELKSKNSGQVLWNKLDSLGLHTLQGIYKFTEQIERDDTWNILHGKYFRFLFIDKKGHREISYHSPGAYAKHFIEIKDFAKADQIIREIYNNFGLKY